MDEYKSAIVKLDALERDRNPDICAYRRIYSDLLEQHPAFEGFWVRWAHTEFRLSSATHPEEKSIEIFEMALKKLPYSLILWVNYLKFVIVLSTIRAESQAELFSVARRRIGDHFWSHEFWDMWLNQTTNRLHGLIDIIENETLHQVTKYYAQLVSALENAKTLHDLSDFHRYLPEIGLIPEKTSLEIPDEELDKFKEVVRSKMKLQYELHLGRVQQNMVFEKQIKRPFYYPDGDLSELKIWLEYAKNSQNPRSVYLRALVPYYEDSKTWIQLLRFLHSSNASPGILDEIYQLTDFEEIRTRYALWKQSDQNPITSETQGQQPRSVLEIIDGRLKRSPYAEFIYSP